MQNCSGNKRNDSESLPQSAFTRAARQCLFTFSRYQGRPDKVKVKLVSYLGWLKITAARLRAAQKAVVLGAAGQPRRPCVLPVFRVGLRKQGQGHNARVFTVGSLAEREGPKAVDFPGFSGVRTKVESWG